MEHLRGGFKANSATVVCEVKETGRSGQLAAPVRDSNDQISCKKFSQNAMFAQKIDRLPPKHTFLLSKKEAELSPSVSASSEFRHDYMGLPRFRTLAWFLRFR